MIVTTTLTVRGTHLIEMNIMHCVGARKLVRYDGYVRVKKSGDDARYDVNISYDDFETATFDENLKTLNLEKVANVI